MGFLHRRVSENPSVSMSVHRVVRTERPAGERRGLLGAPAPSFPSLAVKRAASLSAFELPHGDGEGGE